MRFAWRSAIRARTRKVELKMGVGNGSSAYCWRTNRGVAMGGSRTRFAHLGGFKEGDEGKDTHSKKVSFW